MQFLNPDFALQIAKERHAAELRRAADRRLLARDAEPIRRFIGRQIIRIGERLAAEPSLEPARYR
jgi:hypothetical protein